MAEPTPFEEDSQGIRERLSAESLIVDVDGFEGPLDLLLTLSRTQKVDLRRVSVLQLAEQYLKFVSDAKVLRIELAADYLVMAAWLAFLKSRLLLPPDPLDDGPSGEELAAHLAFQLERLQAMREAAAQLMARDQKGRDFFVRGIPEDMTRKRSVRYTATLLDLMQAYARIRTHDEFRPFTMDRHHVFTLEEALDRMRGMIGFAGDWTDLAGFLPEGWTADPAEAELYEDEAIAELALLDAIAQGNIVVGPYLAEAKRGDDGRPEPTHFREAFRRRGPSNYFHGKQADLEASNV